MQMELNGLKAGLSTDEECKMDVVRANLMGSHVKPSGQTLAKKIVST